MVLARNYETAWNMIDPVNLFASFASGTAQPATDDCMPPPRASGAPTPMGIFANGYP